jgi:ribosomal protein S18 acetylase RimI-like enzyme
MNEIEYSIREAVIADRSHLATLIHFGPFVHQHLDWKPALDWIGCKPYLLAVKNEMILATLACPPDIPGITWLRLFAAGSSIHVEQAWNILWEATKEEFLPIGNFQVAAISLQGWFNRLLEKSEFKQTDNVVVLIWEYSKPLPVPVNSHINLRPMTFEDMAEVLKIDNSAFDLEWRNSQSALELAFQQSTLATIAEVNEEIVGYQFSTSSTMGGHLARLAVRSDMQGKGIGYTLVHQLLNYFSKQGHTHVTVNTQQNNLASLALYRRAGFTITGEAYRVYKTILNE